MPKERRTPDRHRGEQHNPLMREATPEEYAEFAAHYPEYADFLFNPEEAIPEGDAILFFERYFFLRDITQVMKMPRKERQRWVETYDLREKAATRLKHLYPHTYEQFIQDRTELQEWRYHIQHLAEQSRAFFAAPHILEKPQK